MRTLLVLFLSLLVLAGCENVHQPASFTIDPQATARAPWKVDEEVHGYAASIPLGGNDAQTYRISRRFIGVTPEGWYIVQDFYNSVDASGENPKYSDPVAFTSMDAASAFDLNNNANNMNKDRFPIEGSVKLWYSNRLPYVQTRFQSGQLQGVFTKWYANGQKEMEGRMQDNKPQGLWMVWHANGQRMAESHFQDGVSHSRFASWYENGQQSAEGTFQFGKQQGMFTAWNEDGQKMLAVHYDNDVPNGLYAVWYENGQKRVEGHMQNGQKHGLFTVWDEDGRKLREAIFDHDRLVEETLY